MPKAPPARQSFNILAVVQGGRLQYEAVLLAASLRATNPGFAGQLYLAEPQQGPLWPDDPRVTDPATRGLLQSLGAVFLPFENRVFGQSYPYGNKIEALAALPDAPFLFLDTDTLVCGPLDTLAIDFTRPSASMRREGTWPQPDLYGPTMADIWSSLYTKFGLDFASSLDLSQPDNYWQRYLYFNAGWFLHDSPQAFGQRFLDYATAIRDDPPPELVCQSLDPWLDQVALPLVVHALGGGRPGPGLSGLDGDVTCHWRTLPLLYAREADRVVAVLEQVAAQNPVKKVLKEYQPFKKMLYQGKGAAVRALFDRAALPRREQIIRNTIKREGLWVR
ncbi:hypothetical protein GEU84_006490 [Fertoebacter nigrum]|uniref:Uncharacterized protein n=1 Tax=Fertoeibacter niger TaxID=2656921 RepID=A0A8X8GZ17_9RHOB|nr:hypothetical protein [Fertoeibacter niger]NUB44021.1 hypothetical protein [Fertoeibacter niger]